MNPWINVPTVEPFVLESDLLAVCDFNKGRQPFSKHWIHTGRLPEPRLGPVDAPVVLLQLNASYEQTAKEMPLTSSQIVKGRDNLKNEYSPHPCLAEPNLWWDKAFSQLLKKFTRKQLSERVCSIEYFAYPSEKFGHDALHLPSQKYQMSLVQSALDRGAIIVVTRGKDLWTTKIPEIESPKTASVLQTINRQRVWLTPGNLPPNAFDALCEALDA